MIKSITTLTIACILGGGVLFGTVEADTTDINLPRTPQIADLSYDNHEADKLTDNKDVVLKSENRRSAIAEGFDGEKATASKTVSDTIKDKPKAVSPSKVTEPPTAVNPINPPAPHQHKWVAVYKTIKEQTGTQTVIHKYCYKCKADITYENIEEHLKNCGTDMYSTKKLTEPVYTDVQVIDYWVCECGERKMQCLN